MVIDIGALVCNIATNIYRSNVTNCFKFKDIWYLYVCLSHFFDTVRLSASMCTNLWTSMFIPYCWIMGPRQIV